MEKFRVFYYNAITGDEWDEIVLGEDAYKVWDTCEAELPRDVQIDGVYKIKSK